MIENSLKRRQQMLLLTLDAGKAFDRVSWSFIFEVCQKFKFNDIFNSWLKMLYNTPKARIRVNSIISDSFNLFRGTR